MFNFLYAKNYRIVLMDAECQPLPIDYWTIRNYELTFNNEATTLSFHIFGLTKPLDINAMRKMNIVKIIFMDGEERTVYVSTYEVTSFKATLFGDYDYDGLLKYYVEMAVK